MHTIIRMIHVCQCICTLGTGLWLAMVLNNLSEAIQPGHLIIGMHCDGPNLIFLPKFENEGSILE